MGGLRGFALRLTPAGAGSGGWCASGAGAARATRATFWRRVLRAPGVSGVAATRVKATLGAPHPMFGERRSLWAAERASVYLCPPTACGAGICDEPTSAGTVLALSQRLWAGTNAAPASAPLPCPLLVLGAGGGRGAGPWVGEGCRCCSACAAAASALLLSLVRGPPMCGRWPVGRGCGPGGRAPRSAGPPHRVRVALGRPRGARPCAGLCALCVRLSGLRGAPRGPWRARCPREAACRVLSHPPAPWGVLRAPGVSGVAATRVKATLGAPHPMFGERRSLWAAERASVYLCPPTACGAGICDEPTSAGTVLALSQRLWAGTNAAPASAPLPCPLLVLGAGGGRGAGPWVGEGCRCCSACAAAASALLLSLVRGPPMCGRWPVGRGCGPGGRAPRSAGPPHRVRVALGRPRGARPCAGLCALCVRLSGLRGAPRGPWRARCPREAACRVLCGESFVSRPGGLLPADLRVC